MSLQGGSASWRLPSPHGGAQTTVRYPPMRAVFYKRCAITASVPGRVRGREGRDGTGPQREKAHHGRRLHPDAVALRPPYARPLRWSTSEGAASPVTSTHGTRSFLRPSLSSSARGLGLISLIEVKRRKPAALAPQCGPLQIGQRQGGSLTRGSSHDLSPVAVPSENAAAGAMRRGRGRALDRRSVIVV
ncbi:hypothetical protein PYCCODRAFT_1029029 [Trametes coccinea BRFM310]|uniref:Uncharacterized protein n=1 Tax=Trametes coccinea (strain BRFM310) TaxID=1353009 RepID=A0A1Y2IAS7_TRAC3|nr:hypothetical protein PYCCODRAFT_1029029 [Trametes coccinea BRFM310]